MGRNMWYCMVAHAFGELDRAQEFGVDSLILEFEYSEDIPSHGWHLAFDDLALYTAIPGLQKSGKARELTLRLHEHMNKLIYEAARKNIDIYVAGPDVSYRHETMAQFPELSDPARDLMYDLTATRLREIYDALPGLAGIKPYMDEGNLNINNIESDVPPSERMQRLITSLLDVSRSKKRTLIVSTFTLMPHQLNAITGALKKIPLDKHLIVDNYICPGDWGRICLKNPGIGDVGGHPELISFDYCGEVWGQSVIPLCQARLISDGIKYAESKGAKVDGIAGYTTWTGRTLGSLNESTVYAASVLAKNHAADPDQLVIDWATQKYNSKAAPFVAAALGNTFETVIKSWNDLSFWVQEYPKSEIADIYWYVRSLHNESLAIWDESQRYNERLLHYPTEETITAVVSEKDEAIILANKSIAEIEKSKPYLSENDYLEIRRYFDRELIMCRFFRAYSEAFYRTRMWYIGDRSQEAAVRHILCMMSDIINELEQNPDPDFWICTSERIHLCVSQIEDVLNGNPWPDSVEFGSIEEWNNQLKRWGYPISCN